jgi:2',3'-cyclic-nucleotide 2'-phosphodiesterase (5'-nucleotidase family)
MQKIKLFIGLAIIAILAACSPKMQLEKTEKQLYPISAEMPKDSAILAFYLPYKLKLDSIMNDILAVSTKELKKELPEGTLNDFFADAMYDSAKDRGIKFDMAYTNLDGLRISLPEGNIYRYKIFELMPFENAFTTVKFKGEDMKSFFDYIAKNGGDPISGARFIIDNKKAVNITIDGKPFDADLGLYGKRWRWRRNF